MNTCEQIQSTPAATTDARPTMVPRYHVRETEKAYVVTAFVPGTERSSVVTTVDGEHLVIEARRNNSTPEGWRPVHLESAQADYRLVIGMDHRVNREAIVAELSQGVLTVTVPKAEALLPRRIEIKG
jgi:HSP20 family molecular chaperone IbpA